MVTNLIAQKVVVGLTGLSFDPSKKMQELRMKPFSKIDMIVPAAPSCSRKVKKKCEFSIPRMAVILSNIINNSS